MSFGQRGRDCSLPGDPFGGLKSRLHTGTETGHHPSDRAWRIKDGSLGASASGGCRGTPPGGRPTARPSKQAGPTTSSQEPPLGVPPPCPGASPVTPGSPPCRKPSPLDAVTLRAGPQVLRQRRALVSICPIYTDRNLTGGSHLTMRRVGSPGPSVKASRREPARPRASRSPPGTQHLTFLQCCSPPAQPRRLPHPYQHPPIHTHTGVSHTDSLAEPAEGGVCVCPGGLGENSVGSGSAPGITPGALTRDSVLWGVSGTSSRMSPPPPGPRSLASSPRRGHCGGGGVLPPPQGCKQGEGSLHTAGLAELSANTSCCLGPQQAGT